MVAFGFWPRFAPVHVYVLPLIVWVVVDGGGEIVEPSIEIFAPLIV